jgi:hypothetical protein
MVSVREAYSRLDEEHKKGVRMLWRVQKQLQREERTAKKRAAQGFRR